MKIQKLTLEFLYNLYNYKLDNELYIEGVERFYKFLVEVLEAKKFLRNIGVQSYKELYLIFNYLSVGKENAGTFTVDANMKIKSEVKEDMILIYNEVMEILKSNSQFLKETKYDFIDNCVVSPFKVEIAFEAGETVPKLIYTELEKRKLNSKQLENIKYEIDIEYKSFNRKLNYLIEKDVRISTDIEGGYELSKFETYPITAYNVSKLKFAEHPYNISLDDEPSLNDLVKEIVKNNISESNEEYDSILERIALEIYGNKEHLGRKFVYSSLEEAKNDREFMKIIIDNLEKEGIDYDGNLL